MEWHRTCFFSGRVLKDRTSNSPYALSKEHLISKHDLAGIVLTDREHCHNVVSCARGVNSSLGMAPVGLKLVFSVTSRKLSDNHKVLCAWDEYDGVARSYGQHWWSDKVMNMPDSVTPFWSVENEHYGITKEILAERGRCMRWAKRVGKVLIPVLLEFGPEAASFEAHRRKYVLPTLDTSLGGV